jgi:hypothetical protein
MDAAPRLGGNTRFTDPCLTRNDYDLAAPGDCRLPGGEQHGDLCVAPNERRWRRGAGC